MEIKRDSWDIYINFQKQEKAHRYHIDMPSEKYDNKEAIKQIHLYRMPLSHFLYYPFLKFVSHHKAYYQ